MARAEVAPVETMIVMEALGRHLALESDAAQRTIVASAAKVQINHATRWVGQQGVQLHGGIGATGQCHVGHCFRRLSTIEFLFGDSDHHLTRGSEPAGFSNLRDALEYS